MGAWSAGHGRGHADGGGVAGVRRCARALGARRRRRRQRGEGGRGWEKPGRERAEELRINAGLELINPTTSYIKGKKKAEKNPPSDEAREPRPGQRAEVRKEPLPGEVRRDRGGRGQRHRGWKSPLRPLPCLSFPSGPLTAGPGPRAFPSRIPALASRPRIPPSFWGRICQE